MSRIELLVSTDGVAIDLLTSAMAANRRVDRDEREVPMHAYGKAGFRDCPCFQCMTGLCAACTASYL